MTETTSMLQPDPHVDSALQVAIDTMQEVVAQNEKSESDTSKTLASLRFLIQAIATSSQVTPAQHAQLHHLLTLLETVSSAGTPRNRQVASLLVPAHSIPEAERAKAHAVFNVRDINMICQEYGDVYALIEGEKRRRKINRARRRQGVLEIRTTAHDEWKGPVAWIEWTNDLGAQARCEAHDIR